MFCFLEVESSKIKKSMVHNKI